jgi:hypothetical protein
MTEKERGTRKNFWEQQHLQGKRIVESRGQERKLKRYAEN